MTGVAALAMCAVFTSCSHNDDIEPITQAQIDKAKYDQAFLSYVGGKIAANQDWGFGTTTRGLTRSQAAPQLLGIDAPYDEAWVADYNETAKEPNSENVSDNFDNTTYAFNYDVVNYLDWDNGGEEYYNLTNTGKSWDEQLAYALANHPEWLNHNADETFVRNFKITGTYNGGIAVAASEGITDNGTLSGAERTIVVTGTWNITANQTIGSLGKIIIADGGTVNVAQGVTLNMVNQARLVVLSGGKLTGAGKVEVNNGNAVGEENYNAGTIDVATFNNNFGKFYNYGKFLVNEYIGGAQESNFYNHTLAAIDHFSGTANARVFNGCQFYVKNDARLRNYEGIMGSALIVGGQLMFSGSEDGTTTPTYVSLANGAMVKCGTLYNNGTSWSGPTTGWSALEIVNQIDFLNWEQDAPQNGGYFENNIAVCAGTWENVPDGNGMQQKEDNGTEYYTMSQADYKFFTVVANSRGNGGVTKVEKGTDEEVVPADPDFELGVKGCSPGFSRKTIEEIVYDIRIWAEDLSAEEAGDFDFNDIVLDVKYDESNAIICLRAAGGTLPLRIAGNDNWETHKLFNVPEKTMVNTAPGKHTEYEPVVIKTGLRIMNAAEANTVLKLEVFKNGEWEEMTAPQGEPSCKLAVAKNLDWLDERTSIKGTYEKFVPWAQDNNPTLSKWWE